MLIKNATILSDEIIHGDILIEGNIIAEIGPDLGDGDIDASGKIAIPGLINTHNHVAMTTLRGLGEDMELHSWLREKIWPMEEKQTADEIKAAAKLAFLEMIKSGTTAFCEMCIHDPKPIFDAAEEIGIRGVVSRGVLDLNDPSALDDRIAKLKPVLSYGNDLVKPSVSVHATNTCSKELITEAKKLAGSSLFQIHAAETREEVFQVKERHGKFPIEFLSDCNVLDGNSLLVHCGWLTKREISLLKEVNISSCPVSNLKLATGGIAQLKELDAAGANVTLGTDSVASNNSLNMFETMKLASLLQKHHYWKANAIATGKVFDFATRNGAKALKVNSGQIRKGFLADIVLLERKANMHPEHDLISNLVYSANPSNVSDVIIDGKIIMEERAVKGEQEIISRIKEF